MPSSNFPISIEAAQRAIVRSVLHRSAASALSRFFSALASSAFAFHDASRHGSAQKRWCGRGLAIGLWMRGRHPRLLDERQALGPGRKLVAVLLLLIFALSVMVMPIRVTIIE